MKTRPALKSSPRTLALRLSVVLPWRDGPERLRNRAVRQSMVHRPRREPTEWSARAPILRRAVQASSNRESRENAWRALYGSNYIKPPGLEPWVHERQSCELGD